MLTSTTFTSPELIKTATERLRAAHDRIYRWPEGFAGFTAKISVRYDGEVSHGSLTIGPGHAFKLEFDGGEGPRAWALQELHMMAGHRTPMRYEDLDGRHVVHLDPAESHLSLARRRIVADDGMGSYYRINDDLEITEISRAPEGVRFTITTLDHGTAADGRLLTVRFTLSYQDEAGALTLVEAYHDDFVDVGEVTLPSWREVMSYGAGEAHLREVVLTDHQLS